MRNIEMLIDRKPDARCWPENGVEFLGFCPVCKSTKRACIYRDLYDHVFFCAPGTWELYQCKDCDTAYLDPRPNRATVWMAYQNYYTHKNGYAPAYYSIGLYEKFRRNLANGYRNWRFGGNFQPSTFLGVIAAMLHPSKRRTLDAQMRHLPRHANGRSLLDFGCGNGVFVSRAKECGWRTTAMDIDPEAVKVAKIKGVEVYNGDIDDIESLEISFDVITLSHVIEHVHDPVKLLRSCYCSLKPGGMLWIETPNYHSQGHRIYGRNWRGLEPPRHLFLFTSQSLRSLLEKVGFTNIEVQPENPAIFPLVFGSSEAIKAGDDPNTSWFKYARANRTKWKIFRNNSKKNHFQREYITLVGYRL